jgi:pimeloyl-ACP methyl ester carboxylesterase
LDYKKIYEKENLVMKTGVNEFFFEDGQLYYVYVPANVLADPKKGKLLISVHGYSGRKDDQVGRKRVRRAAERWVHLADNNGWIVISPHFDRTRFNNDYQRLNVGGTRSDIRLNQIIAEVKRKLTGLRPEKLLFFGFSGGGQFVHRYAVFNPGRIERAVVAAAGWYLWPDATLPYPIGIEPNSLKNLPKAQILELCKLNLLILVGEHDAEQGAFKRQVRGYNLMAIQGEGRRLRAENWIESLKQFSQLGEKEFKITFEIASNTGHSISKRLKKLAGKYLTDKRSF